MKNKEFNIPFTGLKQGKHKFKYTVNNTFFTSFGYDEFNEAEIQVTVELNKLSTFLELTFHASGLVHVNCDVTNEPFQLPVKAMIEIVVKFGEEFNDEDEALLILPHHDHQVNVSQYIYEMIVLAVPQKRVHPGVIDGTLDSEALKTLEKYQIKEVKEELEEENTDPRWDALKKLITDKKE